MTVILNYDSEHLLCLQICLISNLIMSSKTSEEPNETTDDDTYRLLKGKKHKTFHRNR